MNKLFSEVYGCYFEIVSRILDQASNGISQANINSIINEHGFSETAFHLLPKLIDGEWNLLEKRGDLYYSKLSTNIKRPLSNLELSWLASLINDQRIQLFISDEKLSDLKSKLKDIPPAFNVNDFISVDSHLDNDPYGNPVYINNFHKILKACKENTPILISYDSEKSGRSQRTYHPFKLSYSGLNDKFRLLCAAYNKKTQKLNKITLNLGKIISVEPSNLPYRTSQKDLCELFSAPNNNPPLIVEITKERNSLERFLLQFASFDRYTEYDETRDIYTCKISYDIADETELLIRILSFGPTVKVLSPKSFLDQLKERLSRQMQLIDMLPNNHETQM